jgi:glycosyltransferase involved in cell wall biosynthesis
VTEERPELPLEIKDEPEWKVRRKDQELGLADLIIVPCEWAAASLRFSSIGSLKKVVKVPYGTPADDMSVRTEQPTRAFTVLFAGQVGVRKGVPHLLEAWDGLGLKNARLLLAGEMRLGNTFLNRHSDSFEYLGQLPHEELLELMKRVDLFVFPSLAEGFGLVIGEAMAAGTPVLTTTNTGGPELITNGSEGWCVPAHDVTALAEKIEWSYMNRGELFEMGKLARLKAEQWTWSHYRRSLAEQVASHLTCDPT